MKRKTNDFVYQILEVKNSEAVRLFIESRTR